MNESIKLKRYRNIGRISGAVKGGLAAPPGSGQGWTFSGSAPAQQFLRDDDLAGAFEASARERTRLREALVRSEVGVGELTDDGRQEPGGDNAMATAKVNLILVEQLQKAGVNAIGISGVDGRLLSAKRNDAIKIVENGKRLVIRDDYTGKIESVNGGLIHALLNGGLTPVIQPLAISENGDALNVDADRAAAMVAGAIGAEQLILLTNVPGLLSNFPDESSLIPHIDRKAVDSALGVAEGRMKKKVLGAIEALDQGVSKIVFADGRVEHPLLGALEGKGTVIS